MVYQKQKVYSWKTGSYPVDAQTAGEYIDGLYEREGKFTAKRLLEVSKDDDAVLHPCFEWDDEKAAESYRIDQARKIISNIVVVTVKESENNEPQNPLTVRAFVNVEEQRYGSEGRFAPTVRALSEKETREIVLNNAKRELISFKNKYSYLSEFADVINAIDALDKATDGQPIAKAC